MSFFWNTALERARSELKKCETRFIDEATTRKSTTFLHKKHVLFRTCSFLVPFLSHFQPSKNHHRHPVTADLAIPWRTDRPCRVYCTGLVDVEVILLQSKFPAKRTWVVVEVHRDSAVEAGLRKDHHNREEADRNRDRLLAALSRTFVVCAVSVFLEENLDNHLLRSNQEAVLYRRVTFLAVHSRVEEALWEDLLASDAEAAAGLRIVVESSRRFQDQEAYEVVDSDAGDTVALVEESVVMMGLQRQQLQQQIQKEVAVARQKQQMQQQRFHFQSPVLAAYWFALPGKEMSQSPFYSNFCCLFYCNRNTTLELQTLRQGIFERANQCAE